jgi:hypothetical protein
MILNMFADTGRYEGNCWNSGIITLGWFACEFYHIRPYDSLNVSAGLTLNEVS